MRLLKLSCALAGVLWTAACGDSGVSSHASAASSACEVAAAYAETVIAEAQSQAAVFAAIDEPFSAPLAGGQWVMADERSRSATPPPAALIKRLQDQGDRDAVTRCALVQELLDRRRINYGSKAVDAVSSPNSSEMFEASIHTISMPVVSVNGRQAVLASSVVSGPLAGSGFLQLLERQPNGKWKVVAFSPLWIA